jgi:parallel beta-helix repeat protein
MRVPIFCVAVALAAVFVSPAVLAQAATPVHCGQVLTASTQLTHDLTCGSGVGLTLKGAITLNLAGHRLVGPGKSSAAFDASRGVALTETGTARIENGTIQGWGTGTGPSDDNSGLGATGATLIAMTYVDDGTGLAGSDSTFAVSKSRFQRNTDNGITGLTTRVTVAGSVFLDNGRAISLSDGGSVALSRSLVARNGVGVSCDEVGCTIALSALLNNTTAISTYSTTAKITDNYIDDNQVGVDASFDSTAGYANELARNYIRGNTSGVVLSEYGSAYLHDNHLSGNGIGFSVPASASPPTALLVGNGFTDNHDGVLVKSAGTSLKGNRALDNTRYGIYAVKAKDLGGNIAYGNGHQPQCSGVSCAAHG